MNVRESVPRVNVSVVIPTFDRGGTLGRALDSVVGQTLAPFEIIVIDDGSTDATRDVVRRQYPGVVYRRQDNRGVASARNAGITMAGGDWIAFLDSDDEWMKGKLEAQFTAIRRFPGHKVCHTDEIWIRRGIRVNPMLKHRKSGGWIYRRCLPLCVISPSSVMVHRSVFERVGLFDDTLPACEDYDLWLRVCAAYRVLFVDRPLLRKFGGHADQLSRRYWGMDRFRVRALEKVLEVGQLEEDDRAATLSEMLRKLDILLAGARNRNNAALARECATKIDHYRPLAAELGVTVP